MTPTGIELEVCKDIAERQQKGIAKYGTTVAENPLSRKQWLQHAYEEALDLAVYLKRAMAELSKEEVVPVVKGDATPRPTDSTPGVRMFDCGRCGKPVEPRCNSKKSDGWHWHTDCWKNYLNGF